MLTVFSVLGNRGALEGGSGCQHFHVMITQLSQKHWEWREDGSKDIWQGREERPTMCVGSMDIKAAFDVARPKRTANIADEQATHRWLTAVPMREI